MSSLISDGFNCMIFLRACCGPLPAARAAPMGDSGSQMVRHRLQLTGDRAVDHRIANDDLRTADERPVDADGGLDLLAETPLQRALEPRKLALAKREGAGDLCPREALGAVFQRREQIADVRKQSD